MLIIYVGMASGVGACLRLVCMDVFSPSSFFSKLYFPVVTFLINIVGSLLMGFIFYYLPDTTTNTLISVGVIGGFTTLSTFNDEMILLWKYHKLTCLLYGFLTYLVGLIVVLVMVR
jgi:CrcB protein